MIAGKADHIVLGCTHYPFLLDAIKEIAGEEVVIVDPSPAVAQHTLDILAQNGSLSDEKIDSSLQTTFYSAGSIDNLARMAKSILPSIPDDHFKQICI